MCFLTDYVRWEAQKTDQNQTQEKIHGINLKTQKSYKELVTEYFFNERDQ